MPGGVGLSERLFARHDELVAGAADLIRACPCEAGCPACTGPRLEPDVDGKALALRLLASLGAASGVSGGGSLPVGASLPIGGAEGTGARARTAAVA
jgi:hypothetical protein